MKSFKIYPLLISCAIIASLAFSISIHRLALKNLTTSFDAVKTILAVEHGIFFTEKQYIEYIEDLQEIYNAQISIESNFIPILTAEEQEIFDAQQTELAIGINDQTTKFYQAWKMLLEPIDLGISSNTNSPEILIIHTHGTESFDNDENYDYEATEDRRSEDREVSIAKVASILAQNLNELGINTLYCDEYHDFPVYSGSYNRSLATIQDYIEQYPSIKMVIDVHRDAVISATGEHTYTTIDIDGNECARIMMVIGTNEGGLSHDNWQDNLNNAVNLQLFIDDKIENFMRSINLRDSRFNQHMTSGSMILEVGTSGNTLTHAINAIEVFSEYLAEYLLQ